MRRNPFKPGHVCGARYTRNRLKTVPPGVESALSINRTNMVILTRRISRLQEKIRDLNNSLMTTYGDNSILVDRLQNYLPASCIPEMSSGRISLTINSYNFLKSTIDVLFTIRQRSRRRGSNYLILSRRVRLNFKRLAQRVRQLMCFMAMHLPMESGDIRPNPSYSCLINRHYQGYILLAYVNKLKETVDEMKSSFMCKK